MSITFAAAHTYPGYPAFVARAADDLELDIKACDIAMRQPVLHEISSLVGQALARKQRPHSYTVHRIVELVDGICLAAEAAKRMKALVVAPDAVAPTTRATE